MATQKTPQTGALLLNAPVVPNKFFNPADYGAFCRCAGATGDFVEFEAAITLATAPATNVVDAVTYTNQNGVTETVQLSKQYIINDAANVAVIEELVAEIKAIFAQWVLDGGGFTYAIGVGTLTISGTFQAPFVPVSVTVDSAAVAFA